MGVQCRVMVVRSAAGCTKVLAVTGARVSCKCTNFNRKINGMRK